MNQFLYMAYSGICILITETLLVLQRFHERYDIQVPLLSKLHLCRYLEVSFDKYPFDAVLCDRGPSGLIVRASDYLVVFRRSWVRIPAGSRIFFCGFISYSLNQKA